MCYMIIKSITTNNYKREVLVWMWLYHSLNCEHLLISSDYSYIVFTCFTKNISCVSCKGVGSVTSASSEHCRLHCTRTLSTASWQNAPNLKIRRSLLAETTGLVSFSPCESVCVCHHGKTHGHLLYTGQQQDTALFEVFKVEWRPCGWDTPWRCLGLLSRSPGSTLFSYNLYVATATQNHDRWRQDTLPVVQVDIEVMSLSWILLDTVIM